MPDNIQAVGLEFDTRDFERSIQRAERRMDELEDKVDSSGKAAKRAEGSFMGMAKAVAGTIAAYGGFRALSNVSRFIFDTNVEFEQLEARLVSITGSTTRAEQAFDLITKFATQTPFQVQNLTEAFTQLSAVGIQPTEGHLKDLGNFAAAMGRDVTELTSAVIRAGAGETEALKSFGVVARSEGDKLRVTFRGTTREVEKDFEPVVELFRELARENFGDAMERQMSTMGGALSNVADSAALVAKAMGDAGLNAEMAKSIRLIDQAIQGSKGWATVLGEDLAGALAVVNKALGETADRKGDIAGGAGLGLATALDAFLPTGGYFKGLAARSRAYNDAVAGAPDFYGPQLPTDKDDDRKGGNAGLERRKQLLKDLADAERKNRDAVEATIDSLMDQNWELTAGQEAMLVWGLASKGATQEQIDLALQTYRANQALEEQARKRQIVEDFNRGAYGRGEDLSASADSMAQEKRVAEMEAEYEQLKSTADRMADSMTDAFADVITGTESVSEAFGKMVDEIIRDLIRLAIRRAIMEPLLGAIFGSISMPESGTALNDYTGLSAVPKGRAGVASPITLGAPAAQPVVINQNQVLNFSAYDGPSTIQMLRANKGEILSMVAEGAQESTIFRQMLLS